MKKLFDLMSERTKEGVNSIGVVKERKTESDNSHIEFDIFEDTTDSDNFFNKIDDL